MDQVPTSKRLGDITQKGRVGVKGAMVAQEALKTSRRNVEEKAKYKTNGSQETVGNRKAQIVVPRAAEK